MTLVDNGDGTGELTATPSFDDAGDYDVIVSATDDTGATATEPFVLTVIDVNRPPVADAGPDVQVSPGDSAILDGSNSTDPDGDLIAAYRWRLSAVPENSTLRTKDIADARAAMASITPDVEGDYQLTLSVSDGVLKASDTMVVMAVETPLEPVNANAGPDQNVMVLDTVILDGSASDDNAGCATCTYVWTLSAVPGNSMLTSDSIFDANQPIASFVPDVEGDYVANLSVSNALGSDSDSATVSAAADDVNAAPNADAGSDLTVFLGDVAVLDGTASDDPDDGPKALTFTWRFVSKPAGSTLSNADINGATSSTPSFTPDVVGIYVIRLRVWDGNDADFDQVAVDVREQL